MDQSLVDDDEYLQYGEFDRVTTLRGRPRHSQAFAPDPSAPRSTAPVSTAPETTAPESAGRESGLSPSIRRDHSQWEGVDLLAEDEADHPEASGLSTTATRGSRGDRGSRGGLGSRGGRGGRDGTRSNAESDGNNGNINRVVTGRVVRATRAE